MHTFKFTQRKFLKAYPFRTTERGKFWVNYRHYLPTVFGSGNPTLTETEWEAVVEEDRQNELQSLELPGVSNDDELNSSTSSSDSSMS